MNMKGWINSVRRKILRTLTHNIGTDKNDQNSHLTDIHKVLISRPNSRLGNLLLITPLVHEIETLFPDARIDLFVRGGVAPIVFQNNKSINRIIRLPKKPFKELLAYIGVWLSLRKNKYDLVINIDGGSSSGRLSTWISQSRFKVFNDLDNDLMNTYSDYQHIAKLPVYNTRNFLKNKGVNIDHSPIPSLNLNLTEKEIADGKILLDSLINPEKKTICIYTFATGDKCYSKEWWSKVYAKIKEEYNTQYNILEILPIENVSQIDFQAISYYGKDVRTIAALIANTEIFIGADCGIMHLASAAGTSVVGLFSVSNATKYEPYNNGSISIDTNKTDINTLTASIGNILKNKTHDIKISL